MIKKAIKSLFKLAGYSLVKNKSPEPDGYSAVKVGKFTVKINSKSGLKYCYEHCKDYGTQLSKLTQMLSRRYPDLQVIDIGANQGDSVALIKSGADVPVISVEGDDSLFEQFIDNTAQFSNVSLIRSFLSEDKGEINCEYANVGHNLTLLPAQKSKNSVLTSFTSVDALYATLAVNDKCKLLKIDTEGFDLKILRGSSLFLEAVKPVVLFEMNRENLFYTEKDPFSIYHWLLDRSYHLILFYESDGRFMFSSNLGNTDFLKQIYDYVDGRNAKIRYLDIVVFHKDDDLLAGEFIKMEEMNRLNH
jgi:FkbM family methyltransferase